MDFQQLSVFIIVDNLLKLNGKKTVMNMCAQETTSRRDGQPFPCYSIMYATFPLNSQLLGAPNLPYGGPAAICQVSVALQLPVKGQMTRLGSGLLMVTAKNDFDEFKQDAIMHAWDKQLCARSNPAWKTNY